MTFDFIVFHTRYISGLANIHSQSRALYAEKETQEAEHDDAPYADDHQEQGKFRSATLDHLEIICQYLY